FGESGATSAEDAALPVEQDEIRDLDRLLVVPLLFDEAGLARPVGEGLVLEGALPALVAYRAVEGVVDEEVLEDPFLGLGDGVVLGVDDHAVGDRCRAGGDDHRAPRALDLDQAHAAHSDRSHPGMPTEAGDVDTVLL